jgi:CMP-N,N'-diacetyllegionaminic acid synthase
MKIVSVITARGGSKGIPKKNIIKINEIPLIWYTINASQKSKVHETWVSTDCKEIASVAQDANAKVIDRPKELADDVIMPDASLVHFAENVDFDILVFIQPTSPLLCHYHINQGLDMMTKYDSVFSAYKEHWLPRWSKNANPIDWSPSFRPRRQDIDEQYVENGAFYITTKKNLLKSKLRYSGNIGIVEMSLSESYQLDNNNDLQIIEKLL